MSKKKFAMAAIIISALIWATAGVSAKKLLLDLPPFTIGFWRFLLATLCIIPFYIHEKRKNFHIRSLIFPSLIGALNVPFYYFGINTTTANSATLIYTAGPLVTAVLSYFLIREKNSLTKWVGIILGLIGVLTIVILPMMETNQHVGNLSGNLFLTGGMLSWTIYTIALRRFRSSDQYSPISTTTVYFFVSTLVCFSLTLLNHQPILPQTLLTPHVLPMLIYTSFCLTFLTYFMYQWALAYLSVTTASFKQYIETVAAIGLNIVFLGETVTIGFIFGSILVVTGLIVITIGTIRSSRR